MGDELTREDLINIGELDPDAEKETPTKEAPESRETEGETGETPEETETEQAAKDKKDAAPAAEGKETPEDEPEPVQKRIDKLTWEREETKRKLDLLKRDPDRYYALYPEEKPAGKSDTGRAEPDQGKPPTFREALGMRITGGAHDGKTLRDLMASGDPEDQADAWDIYQTYRANLEQQRTQAQTQEQQIKERVTREHSEFVDSRARDLFGKDGKTLTADEAHKVEQVFNQILDEMEREVELGLTWAQKHGVYNPDSAYRLLTVNDQIKAGVKAIIDSARKSGPSHIEGKNAGPSSAGGSIYDQLAELSAVKVAEKLDWMPDAKVEEFWKKAPPAFLKKFRDLADAWV